MCAGIVEEHLTATKWLSRCKVMEAVKRSIMSEVVIVEYLMDVA